MSPSARSVSPPLPGLPAGREPHALEHASMAAPHAPADVYTGAPRTSGAGGTAIALKSPSRPVQATPSSLPAPELAPDDLLESLSERDPDDLEALTPHLQALEAAGEPAPIRALLTRSSPATRQALLLPQVAAAHPLTAGILLDLEAQVCAGRDRGSDVIEAAMPHREQPAMGALLNRLFDAGPELTEPAQVQAALGKPVALRELRRMCRVRWNYGWQLPAQQVAFDTLLLASLRAGEGEVAEALVHFGVPANSGSSQADNPLDVALASGAWEAALALLTCGADVHRFGMGPQRLATAADPELTKQLQWRLFQCLPGADEALWAQAKALLPIDTFADCLAQALPADLPKAEAEAYQRLLHGSRAATPSASAALLAAEARLLAHLAEPTPVQRAVLARARAHSAIASPAATPALAERAAALGYDAEQLATLRAHVQRAPLTINFDPNYTYRLTSDNLYKNQYMSERSSGYLDPKAGGKRDGWERRLFGEDLYPGPHIVGNDRPRYGTLNAAKARLGASQYGAAILVLHEATRAWVTVTPTDSSNERLGPETVGTLTHGLDHVLLAHGEPFFARLMEVSLGNRALRPHQLLSGYEQLEAQIHLPMVLRPGLVKKVVAHRSMPGYGGVLQDLATHLGARLTWHGITADRSWQLSYALKTAHHCGWEVQTWMPHRGQNYLAYAKFKPNAGVTHTEVTAPSADRARTLATLGASGKQVVGLSLEHGGTERFLVKTVPGEAAPLEYVMHTGDAPLAIAQAHEHAGFSLRALATAEEGTWQVLLARPTARARAVTHGMETVDSRADSENAEVRFDDAYSHGKQRGTVVALQPRDPEAKSFDVYYVRA